MSFQEYSGSLRSKLGLGRINAKLVVGLAAFAIAAIALSAYTLFTTSTAYSDGAGEIEVMSASEPSDEANAVEGDVSVSAGKEICVHVAGCVKAPGVYRVAKGSRIDDVVKAAGGFTKSADDTAINLAEVASDGQQVMVPKKSKTGTNGSAVSASSSKGQSKVPPSSGGSSGLVNINTATSEELQTLSGIGEAKAKKIIDYREQNGSFSSIDDLTNVSGIGEKTLESIRSSICV